MLVWRNYLLPGPLPRPSPWTRLLEKPRSIPAATGTCRIRPFGVVDEQNSAWQRAFVLFCFLFLEQDNSDFFLQKCYNFFYSQTSSPSHSPFSSLSPGVQVVMMVMMVMMMVMMSVVMVVMMVIVMLFFYDAHSISLFHLNGIWPECKGAAGVQIWAKARQRGGRRQVCFTLVAIFGAFPPRQTKPTKSNLLSPPGKYGAKIIRQPKRERDGTPHIKVHATLISDLN